MMPDVLNAGQGTVLIVDKELSIGGRQRVVVETAIGLREICGRNVVVAAGYGPLAEELQERGGVFEPLPAGGYGALHQLRSAQALDRLVRKHNAQILHSHCRYHNLSSLLACSLLRTPALRLSTAHNVFPDRHWAGFFARYTICVSPAVESYVRNVSSAHTRVVLNGIPVLQPLKPAAEVRRRLGLEEGSVVFLHVARLEEQKAQYLLLEAFASMLRMPDCPPGYLLVVGDGSLRRRLVEDIERHRLTGRAFLLGERTDIADLMHAADAFVLSSRWEGLPITLIEAAFSGLPLVSFNVGGVSEIIVDGVTGYLLEPGAVGSLAERMFLLAEDPVLRKNLGAAASRLYREKFSIERCVKETERFYVDALRGEV